MALPMEKEFIRMKERKKGEWEWERRKEESGTDFQKKYVAESVQHYTH